MTADTNNRFCQRNKRSTWTRRATEKRTQDHSIFMPKIKNRGKKSDHRIFKLQNPRRYLRFNYCSINSIIKTMIMFVDASHLHFLHWIEHDKERRRESKVVGMILSPNLQNSTVWSISVRTHFRRDSHVSLKWRKNCRPTRNGPAQSEMFTPIDATTMKDITQRTLLCPKSCWCKRTECGRPTK